MVDVLSTPKNGLVTGLQFFALLCADDNFCSELGRVVLAAGRLETALRRYLAAPLSSVDTTKATLGKLIEYCKRHKTLTRMIPSLEMVRDQRNYLTHNIYALLSDHIGETILERANLLTSDLNTYTERAWELKNNLNDLAKLIENAE